MKMKMKMKMKRTVRYQVGKEEYLTEYTEECRGLLHILC